MIKTIIEQEQNRLRQAGFDSEIQTISVGVGTTQQQLYLGNDIYILTGIRLSDEDVLGDLNSVILSSPTEQLSLTQQRMSQLGTSIVKVFRHNIIIRSFAKATDIVKYRVSDYEYDPDEIIEAFKEYKYLITYDFVKRNPFTRKVSYIKQQDTLDEYKFFGVTKFQSYADYEQFMRSQSLDDELLSNSQWQVYKQGYLKYGYSISMPQIDLFSYSQQAIYDFLNYMTYSVGTEQEKNIQPYQLEFVRITPIKQK